MAVFSDQSGAFTTFEGCNVGMMNGWVIMSWLLGR
jgi:biotin transporter BioY